MSTTTTNPTDTSSPVPPAKSTTETAGTSPEPSKAPDMVTLDQLAREMKVSPRDARMLLRLAAKQAKLYPTLGKEHVARQPWQWAPDSKGLAEAKKALAVVPEA